MYQRYIKKNYFSDIFLSRVHMCAHVRRTHLNIFTLYIEDVRVLFSSHTLL